jgi:hypothetical protein
MACTEDVGEVGDYRCRGAPAIPDLALDGGEFVGVPADEHDGSVRASSRAVR